MDKTEWFQFNIPDYSVHIRTWFETRPDQLHGFVYVERVERRVVGNDGIVRDVTVTDGKMRAWLE